MLHKGLLTLIFVSCNWFDTRWQKYINYKII